jgi:hypothetical protein
MAERVLTIYRRIARRLRVPRPEVSGCVNLTTRLGINEVDVKGRGFRRANVMHHQVLNLKFARLFAGLVGVDHEQGIFADNFVSRELHGCMRPTARLNMQSMRRNVQLKPVHVHHADVSATVEQAVERCVERERVNPDEWLTDVWRRQQAKTFALHFQSIDDAYLQVIEFGRLVKTILDCIDHGALQEWPHVLCNILKRY